MQGFLTDHITERLAEKSRRTRLFLKTVTRRAVRLNPSQSAREVSNRLSALADPLAAAFKRVEPDFLDLGRALQTIHRDAEALKENALAAVELVGGDSEESPLGKVGSIVRGALNQLRRYEEDISNHLDHLRTVQDDLGTLLAMFRGIDKIALTLNVIALNIGVESSRSARSMVMFGVIAEQIKALYTRIIGIAGTIKEDAESVRASQNLLHKQISGGLEKVRGLAADAEKSVEESFRETEQIMTLSFQAAEQASLHSRQIVRRVGEIVVGIQLHDSLNQRVEHIIKTLHDVEDICRGEGAGAKDPIEERLAAASSIVDLQCAQIEEALAEISETYRKSKRAFREIGEEVGRLGEGLSALDPEDKTSRGREGIHDDPFETLNPALHRLNLLLGEGEAMMRLIEGAAARSSETTSGLLNHLRDIRGISLETRRKALNAIINAAHLGDEGQTLEILAHEIKSLSDQCNALALQVEEVLSSISVSVGKLRDLERDDSGKGDPEKGAKVSLETAIEDTLHAYERFRADSSAVFEQSRALKETISQQESTLEFLLGLGGELDSYLQEMNGVAQVLLPYTDRGKERATVYVRTISERYTMERERDIHSQLIGRGHAVRDADGEEPARECGGELRPGFSESPILPRTGSEEDRDAGEDLGENVEFF